MRRRQLISVATGLVLYGSLAIICIAQQSGDAVPFEPKIYDQYLGSYQLPSGDLIVIGRTLRRLYYYAPRTGEARGLDRGTDLTTESRWSAGPSLLVFSPVEFTVTFIKNRAGEVTGLELNRIGLPVQKAKKAKFYREEKVSFHSGGATLAGTLLVPSIKGPHPAVVFVHGSGEQDRNGYVSLMRFVADHFARHGIAVLLYDKRGIGQSTGNWATENFDDLAQDALAGLQLLQGRSDISPKQVGMWGISQAGWIMAKATTRSKEIAFIICVSCAGSGMTTGEQVLYDFENQLRAAGFTRHEIDEWVRACHLLYEHLRAGQGSDRKELDELLLRLQQNPKLTRALRREWFLARPDPKIDWEKRDQWFFLYDPNFDPVPVWEQYEGSVLGIFGELDALTPVKQVVPSFAKALVNRKKTDFTIALFPKAHHILMEMETETINDDELPKLKRYVPGYFDLMTDWLMKRVGIKR